MNPRYKRLNKRMDELTYGPTGKLDDLSIYFENYQTRTLHLDGQHALTYTGPIQFLQSVKHGMLATTSPSEIWELDDALRLCHGRVLVGGLGLGLFVRYLQDHEQITSAVFVERHDRVLAYTSMALVQMQDEGSLPAPRVQSEFCRDRITRFINTAVVGKQDVFDSAFLNTYMDASVDTWANEVVPARRMLAKAKVNTVIVRKEADMLKRVRGMISLNRPHPVVDVFNRVWDSQKKEFAKDADETIAKMNLSHLLCKPQHRLWEPTFGRYWEELVNAS